MPIEEIDDYPEKMTEFELHWDSVNVELGGTPETEFKLAGDFDRAAFGALKAAVVAALTNQEGLENNLDFARADRDQLRGELRQQLILFRNTVKTLLSDSRYVRALPDTPPGQSDQQKLLDAWDDAAHIWTQINTDQPAEVGPALTLRGGYALAQFQTDIATMRTRYDAVKAGERATADGRGTRDELLESAYDRMVQYRQRLPLTLADDHPLVQSMPRITPSAGGGAGNGNGSGGNGNGGQTGAVTLSGQWDATISQAVLSWTEWSDPDLQNYQPRYSQGPSYDESSNFNLNSQAPGTTEMMTSDGLLSPGDTATYRVYVVLTTGGEIASNDLTITRP